MLNTNLNPETNEPDFSFEFPSVLGTRKEYNNNDTQVFSKRVLDIFVRDYGITKDDTIGFSGDYESMVYIMTDFIEIYLKSSNSIILTPVFDSNGRVIDLPENILDQDHDQGRFSVE